MHATIAVRPPDFKIAKLLVLFQYLFVAIPICFVQVYRR